MTFCFAIHCIATPAGAQPEQYTFDHITIEQGLSQSTVYAVTQDAQGFLWFGTRDGLNKYDSRKIKIYRHDETDVKTLSDNTIYALHCDRHGRLWVATGKGLNLYDAGKDEFTRILSRKNDSSSLSDNKITDMLEDRNGNIWIATRNGLNLLQGNDSFSFLRFQHDNNNANSLIDNDIRSIFEDGAGNLWIGTSSGLSKFIFNSGDDFTFTSYRIEDKRLFNPISNWINTIAESGDSKLLIGTEKNGLISFDRETGKFDPMDWIKEDDSSPESVRKIVRRTAGGDFWIGTIGGLYIVNPGEKKRVRLRNIADNSGSISDNSIRSLYTDRDGSMWIGTFHGGMNIYSPLSRQFRHVRQVDNMQFKIASALFVDAKNNFWIGTEGNGLFFRDYKNGITKHFTKLDGGPHSLSHNNVKCLMPDDDKGLWVGTIGGLDYFDFRQNKFISIPANEKGKSSLPDNRIYDLARDHDGFLWIATYRGGLCRYDHIKKTFETFLPDDQVTNLFFDSQQNLWVGTVYGLRVKYRGQKKFTKFLRDAGDKTSIAGNYILCIYEDSSGRMWIGTRDDGLSMLSAEGGHFKNFGIEQGLPGNSVFGIQQDRKGSLWMSTSNGLSMLDPETYEFRNYDHDDGLICKTFNSNSYCEDNSGNFYFGGYNGIVSFNPDEILENTTVPKLTFVGLRLFNKPVWPGDGILEKALSHTEVVSLHHHQNVFSIEFAVLNYINSKKNRFAYRLQGFEDEWNYPTEPVATYMNLKPGNYTLLAKGSNNNGIWNETPIALKLKIVPPPWKSWWAYIVYVLIFSGLLFLWAQFHKKRLLLEHDLEREHLDKSRREELHQAKLRFFTNMAHEIRTPLTLMTSPVEKMLERCRNDKFMKKELSLVKLHTDRLQRLLNQLLDFHKQETGNVKLKVREGNIVEFVDEVQFSFQEYAQSRKVTLRFCSTESDVRIYFDRDELSKVFCNLLLNAFKFTPGGGEVTVRVERKLNNRNPDFYVEITVEDNGLGIPAAQRDNIFHRFYQAENSGVNEGGVGIGLALTKGIIDLHRGAISVESSEATADAGGFTRFTIVLPAGSAHFSPDQVISGTDDHEAICDDGELEDAVSGDEEQSLHKWTGEGKPLVLLVEDHEEIRAYLRDTIKSAYDVLDARNGLEGLTIAVEKLPDLIISDVMMPRMDGLTMVNRLKSDQRTSHIPVILLTARGALNYQVEGFQTGADDYISKPFSLRLLLVKMKNHLVIRERLKSKYNRMVTLQPAHQEIENPDDKFLQCLMRILEENIVNADFNVSRLVREIGMSRPVLFRKVKMLTGLSVIDLIRNIRLKKAEMLLKQKKLSISEVAFTVGFNDPKYFSKSFRTRFGKSPSQYLEDLH